MGKTGAERQATWRAAQRDRLAASLAENRRLRAEVAALESALADANGELARLAQPACAHPSEVVQDGRCGSCGEWL